jgi:thiamine biosynthesis lipoprotein
VIARHCFNAMGTTVEFLVEADETAGLFITVEAEFERLEQVMSRFRPDSELSRLNEHGELEASPDLAEVVSLAVEARERTGGRFDLTIHDAVVAAGYDRDFSELPVDAPAAAAPSPGGGGVAIDGLHIRLEPGFRLDLGGIGKGYAAERAAQLLALAGPCLVSAGGDIAIRGVPSDGYWPVEVDDGPTLGLSQGGLATSGSDRRRWRRGGVDRHHLIDPVTGEPAESDLLRVTAIGHDAVEAEVLAKSLYLGGRAEAEASGIPAVLVTTDGETVLAGGIG